MTVVREFRNLLCKLSHKFEAIEDINRWKLTFVTSNSLAYLQGVFFLSVFSQFSG